MLRPRKTRMMQVARCNNAVDCSLCFLEDSCVQGRGPDQEQRNDVTSAGFGNFHYKLEIR